MVIAGHADGPADYGGAYTLGNFAEQGIGGVNGAFLSAAGPALLVVDAVRYQRPHQGQVKGGAKHGDGHQHDPNIGVTDPHKGSHTGGDGRQDKGIGAQLLFGEFLEHGLYQQNAQRHRTSGQHGGNGDQLGVLEIAHKNIGHGGGHRHHQRQVCHGADGHAHHGFVLKERAKRGKIVELLFLQGLCSGNALGGHAPQQVEGYQTDGTHHAHKDDEQLTAGIVVLVIYQQGQQDHNGDLGTHSADTPPLGQGGAACRVVGNAALHGAVGHIHAGVRHAPQTVNAQAHGDLYPVGRTGCINEQGNAGQQQHRAGPLDPGLKFTVLAGFGGIAQTADDGVVDGVKNFAQQNENGKVLGIDLHTGDIEQHQVAVNERKAHIAAKVAKGIADLIAHTEGAQLFVGAHIHIGSLQIPILYDVYISFYYTYSIKNCNGK